ncbi:RagB/SusD family nutrient uptake outer membrane protein [Pedobacter sp. ASV1-7]|uniref:RagB/SusD family nutrient uptake outer membrane protein n=1 Tax=Pedobacter sp. ASV1-7 TaxID=3145237 RepID=UPI0032E9347C
MKSNIYIVLVTLLSLTLSCKNYVEIDPPRTELSSESLFVNDKTAISAMVGIYSDMNSYNYFYANLITMFMGGMCSDEFTYALTSTAEFEEFKNNNVLPTNRFVDQLWSEPYTYNYRANAVIEGVTASRTLSPEVKNQLLGEAKFMRAFFHFYLVNTFGDVPLILDTDVLKNTNLPRTPAADVYKAIIADLIDAKSLLDINYPVNGERTRPTKGAATLLLARAYLYTGNNVQAEIEASEVINNPNYQLLQGADMNKSFLANSREAIWQLQVVNTGGGRNTWEGFTMTPASMTAPVAYYRLTKGAGGLVDAFEPGDLRKAYWTGAYTTTATPPLTHTYPYKYKIRTTTGGVTEYSMVMRYAEAYLIRAEARIQQSKFGLGKDDLDVIRSRAGFITPLPSFTTIPAGMLKVEQERRVELFTEWGHRWYDLKRWKSVTGDLTKTRADDVLSLTKPSWKSTAILMPIPSEARKTNSSLTPNPGYN